MSVRRGQQIMNKRILVILAVLIFTTVDALSQTSRGSLSGTVTDPKGDPVRGATVTVRNAATNFAFQTTTNDLGNFVTPSLAAGHYGVVVQAPGFKKADVPDVVIDVSIAAKVSVALEVGTVAEEVTVVGEAQEVINTLSPVLTNVISTKQIKDLPLPGRNPVDLARLQAGLAVSGTDTRNASVGGLRGTGTNVTQDGINAMDNFVKTSSFFALTAPSINSTSEFSVTVGTIGSDAGRGLAQVRIVTPSGGNQIHGSTFYAFRSDALNANTFFNNQNGTPKQRELQHFFGFTLGGPVYLPKIYDGRDKSFWFMAYEGFRENFQVTRNRTVLTPEARQGIFRYNGSNGQLQSVNLLSLGTAKALNPITLAQINAMPLPNNTLVGDGFNTAGSQFNVTGTDPNDKIDIRGDQKLVDNSPIGSHKLEVVVHRAHFLLTPDTFNSNEAPFPGGVSADQESTRWLTAAAIHSTFGSSATNEVRFGHQRAPVGFLRQSQPTVPFITFSRTSDAQLTNFDNTFLSQGRNTTVYQFLDNFSLVRGAHTFKMGAEVQSITAYNFNDAGINPNITLGVNSANANGILNTQFPNLPAGNTGTGIANRARDVYNNITGFLASATQTFNVVSPTSGFVPGATRERDIKQRDLSLYFEDQWRMRRNFTLNYGVRWEFLGVPQEINGLAIQPTNGIAGLFGISGTGNLFNPGVLKGTAPTILDFVNGKTGKALYGDDYNNFAPFLGFAYSPSFEHGPLHWLFGREGKSSIRAGFSIVYLHDGGTVVTNALGTGTTNPGLIQAAANNTPTGVLTAAGVPLRVPGFKIPISDAENFAANFNNGLWTFDPNLRVPYVEQWSFGIEREFATNMVVEARYVGNHAVKLYRGIDFNEVNIFENGFLREFLNAQKNLAINNGTTFAPGAPGTVPLPTLATLFAGLPAGTGFANSTFINNLTNNNVGAMAFSLANSSTFQANRANLAPNFFLVNPNASFARLLTNGSFSNYHSFQLEVRRRMSRGLYFQANYTFSKAITDGDLLASQSTLESPRTLRDSRLDRHRASFDQNHRFIANTIYELPFGRGRRFLNGGFAPIRKALEGWSVGSIINWQSGQPRSIFSNRSTFNQQNPGLNPVQLVGMSFDEFKRNIGIFRTGLGVFWINPNLLNITTDPRTGRLATSTIKDGIFAAPPPGTLGNFPRNALNGPRFFQTDISVIKRTYFKEQGNVEFKLNMQNVFNNANFQGRDFTFTDATFGLLNSTFAGSQRNMVVQIGINW